jgi:hypothetical protein
MKLALIFESSFWEAEELNPSLQIAIYYIGEGNCTNDNIWNFFRMRSQITYLTSPNWGSFLPTK